MRDIKKIRLNEVRVVFDPTNKKEYHYTNVGGYKEEYELGDFLVDYLNYDNLFNNERLRKIVDFCFNFDNIEKLNNLTPFQRRQSNDAKLLFDEIWQEIQNEKTKKF